MKKLKLVFALCFVINMANAQVIWTMADASMAVGYSGDGDFAFNAKFNTIEQVAVDASGNTYACDRQNNRIRKIDSKGIVTTFAGTGTAGNTGDGGAATSAQISGPIGIAVDASGNVYFTSGDVYIRKVNTSGVISTIAGTGTAGNTGDGGAATSAQINPSFLAFDSNGDLYLTSGGVKIRKITMSTGIISTVAGTGTSGYSGNGGQATSANMSGAIGMYVDGSGNIYVSEMGNQVVRKINTSGIINLFAGTAGTIGHTGNGGAATAATLYNPCGLSTDASGNVYICDANNKVIRQVNTSGIISDYTLYGTITSSYDVLPVGSTGLSNAISVCFNSAGDMIISDVATIRKASTNCPALAGPNRHDQNSACCGCNITPVQIGSPSITNATYSWSPSTNLSSTTIAQPTSSWCSTTVKTYTVTVSNANCTTATSTVTVTTDHPLGGYNGCCRMGQLTSETAQGLPVNFSAYPSPATNNITVSLYTYTGVLKIMDVTGRTVYEAKKLDAGEVNIDVSKFAKGVYFVVASIGDVTEKQKMIIE